MKKVMMLAITGMLAAGAVFPAAAAKTVSTTEAYNACVKRALDMGLFPGQAGRHAYLDQCMGGSPAARKLDQETRGRLRCKGSGCAR
jgi:hypothetical protein